MEHNEIISGIFQSHGFKTTITTHGVVVSLNRSIDRSEIDRVLESEEITGLVQVNRKSLYLDSGLTINAFLIKELM